MMRKCYDKAGNPNIDFNHLGETVAAQTQGGSTQVH